jgi:hypothetical protein
MQLQAFNCNIQIASIERAPDAALRTATFATIVMRASSCASGVIATVQEQTNRENGQQNVLHAIACNCMTATRQDGSHVRTRSYHSARQHFHDVHMTISLGPVKGGIAALRIVRQAVGNRATPARASTC